MNQPLRDRHLAELHALAAELGVPRYRLLRREQLVHAIRERGGDELADREAGEAPGAPAPSERPGEAPGERPAEEPGEAVTGILDVTPRRFGFLRLSGLGEAEGDVYVSASQIRRCELRPGDEVSGPARRARRDERHRALVHVDAVNGAEPGAQRPAFEDLTPVAPQRRLALGRAETGSEAGDVLVRAVDLLCPLALGQRVLVRAAPRSGRTSLLRALASALAAETAGVRTLVLLIDERPEEATAWREALPDAELAVATAELGPAEQARTAELALARAKRLAESGEDVALLVDSLSRLAVAGGGPAEAKALFGSGRALAADGGGTLTVIATALEGADDPEGAARAVLTTENALITLDPELAAAGVVPALDPAGCRASDEEALRPPEELEAARHLRAELAGLAPADAARLLRERVTTAQADAGGAPRPWTWARP